MRAARDKTREMRHIHMEIGADLVCDRKRDLLRQAAARAALPANADALTVLAEFGGFEIAMMAGAMLGAAERGMTLARLSELVGVSVVNLSILKNDRARAIRYSTLSAICRALDCEVGELLVRAD